jgi:hypothetical protein
MTRHRKDRGLRTERVVASYLQQWWPHAGIGRGAGKDITNVPFDIEVKAASEYLAFMRFGDLVQLLLPSYGDINKDSVELVPERCTKCGSWKLEDVPCRTCQG